MESCIVMVNKTSVSRHSVLLEYDYKAKLRLKRNTGRDFTRGGKRGRKEIMAEILCSIEISRKPRRILCIIKT